MENKRIPDIYASRVFSEDVMRERLPKDVYKSLINTMATGKEIDASIADIVASAMKDWAIEHGATHFTHWFQPLTGVTAEKHDAFLTPVGGGKAIMEFSGKELIKGEPDASSFPSGGLRATFEARGYTAWDPASYAFIKDGSLYIPTAFCSYTGEALDTKTPLLRSMDAISCEAIRILRLFGDTATKRVTPTVGAEQEYFLIDEADFKARRDLFYCGRTLFGAPAIKGQELEDHYFGAIPLKVNEFMKELDEELWTLGISAKTKHNEAAPAQHELAPIFSTTNIAVDHNLLTMEYMKRIASKHGMTCLLAEKPFMGITGSGKHNNWSIGTDTGSNLLKPGKNPADNKLFLIILAAVIKAVDEYQDLLRISAATAGNDCRLGGDEAPPAIISIFLGDELEMIIDSIIKGSVYSEKSAKYMSLGIPSVPSIRRDNTDRNRTSPFAFTGNKFEFRMVGSSQNIALSNIVLNTAVANSFSEFADKLEAAENFDSALNELIALTFKKHKRILFAGNSYSAEWEKEAFERGLSNFKTAPEAYEHFTDEKNIALFTKFGVMSEVEMRSRREIFFESYRKIKNIEARTMLEMTVRDIIPAVSSYVGKLSESVVAKCAALKGVSVKAETDIIDKLSELLSKTYDAYNALDRAEKKAVSKTCDEEAAFFYKDTVEAKMLALRKVVDEMEILTAREAWPMPTYGDIMFRI
ncbi:MAG: glutamine synthetase type III [Ruminococcaceae bacterium]|nr:glutamine synthetase type III [Oscillospiraceae bacterium]